MYIHIMSNSVNIVSMSHPSLGMLWCLWTHWGLMVFPAPAATVTKAASGVVTEYSISPAVTNLHNGSSLKALNRRIGRVVCTQLLWSQTVSIKGKIHLSPLTNTFCHCPFPVALVVFEPLKTCKILQELYYYVRKCGLPTQQLLLWLLDQLIPE